MMRQDQEGSLVKKTSLKEIKVIYRYLRPESVSRTGETVVGVLYIPTQVHPWGVLESKRRQFLPERRAPRRERGLPRVLLSLV